MTDMITNLRSFSSWQTKLAARRVRRQEEARRQSEEFAAQRILEEQSQAIAANRPVDADHVVVPDVILPRETAEEEVRTCRSHWRPLHWCMKANRTLVFGCERIHFEQIQTPNHMRVLWVKNSKLWSGASILKIAVMSLKEELVPVQGELTKLG